MKAIPALTLYYQIYYKDRGDEVAYCPNCENTELLVDDPHDEVNFALCPDCHSKFYRDQILWKDAEKDSEHNPPPDSEKYHSVFVVQQGQGDWANVKYRTFLEGEVIEHDKLLTLIRKLKPLTASTLITILEGSSSSTGERIK